MSKFQERLKQILDEKEIKPADLAKALGISKAAISIYLNNKNREPKALFVP